MMLRCRGERHKQVPAEGWLDGTSNCPDNSDEIPSYIVGELRRGDILNHCSRVERGRDRGTSGGTNICQTESQDIGDTLRSIREEVRKVLRETERGGSNTISCPPVLAENITATLRSLTRQLTREGQQEQCQVTTTTSNIALALVLGEGAVLLWYTLRGWEGWARMW